MDCPSISSTTVHYPYKPNTVLRATFLDDSDAVIGMSSAPKSLKEVQLKVMRTLATTLSCVLLVEPVGAHRHRFPRQLILKVYDERFADNIREDYKLSHWTPARSILLDEFKALPEHLKPQIVSEQYDLTSKWWNKSGDHSSSDSSVSAPTCPSGTTGTCIGSTCDNLPAKQGCAPQQTPEPDPDDWENIETVPESDSPSDSDSDSDSEHGADDSDNDDDDEPEHVSMEEADRALRERLRPGFLEAVGELACGKLHRDEMAAYRQLNSLQGKTIPGCYGSTIVQPLHSNSSRGSGGSRSPSPTISASSVGHGGPKALLLQYIEHSFTLRDVPEKIPDTSLWSDIGKSAVKTVQDIGDLGVLNHDIRLDNFLVAPVLCSKRAKPTASKRKNSPDREPPEKKKKYRVVMIDFGLARVWNEEEETEEEFRRARLEEDEEGAVGCVFEGHLCKALKVKVRTEESPFKYRPSNRLRRNWDPEEN